MGSTSQPLPSHSFWESHPAAVAPETSATQSVVDTLSLAPHIEGGYYAVTHVNSLLFPSPFPRSPACENQPYPSKTTPKPHDGEQERPNGFDPETRTANTAIFYYLTPKRPKGSFHRNRCAIIHSLHRGRGGYVVIHPSETPGASRVEVIWVGEDIKNGEKLQWVVDGGTYKASFLLPDEGGEEMKSDGLLITEVAVPGFEYYDHDFLTLEGLVYLVGEERARQLAWLTREGRLD